MQLRLATALTLLIASAFASPAPSAKNLEVQRLSQLAVRHAAASSEAVGVSKHTMNKRQDEICGLAAGNPPRCCCNACTFNDTAYDCADQCGILASSGLCLS